MNKFAVALIALFGVVLCGCGTPTLTITPIASTYTYGDPEAEFLEITNAPAASVIHYTMTEDGSDPATPTCDSTIYSDRIPLYIGTTRVMAIACDADGKIVATTGDVSHDIIINDAM